MSKILIVEDEENMARFIELELLHEGYEVIKAEDGRTGLDIAESGEADLILLDIMIPELNGLEVLRRVRRNSDIPIILLTARDAVMDKVSGLDAGADDYITKPFEIREVIARINAIFRRAGKKIEKTNNEISGLIIDEDRRLVIKEGKEILLKRKEFEILNFLCKNKGKVFTRDELLNNIWGYDYYGDTRTVDVHIRRLRASLGEDKGNSTVETVFGVGYVVK